MTKQNNPMGFFQGGPRDNGPPQPEPDFTDPKVVGSYMAEEMLEQCRGLDGDWSKVEHAIDVAKAEMGDRAEYRPQTRYDPDFQALRERVDYGTEPSQDPEQGHEP